MHHLVHEWCYVDRYITDVNLFGNVFAVTNDLCRAIVSCLPTQDIVSSRQTIDLWVKITGIVTE